MFYTKGIQNCILYFFELAHQYFLKSILVCNVILNILKTKKHFFHYLKYSNHYRNLIAPQFFL